MINIWNLADARTHFDQLITAAQDSPQTITHGGAPLVTVARALPLRLGLRRVLAIIGSNADSPAALGGGAADR